MSASPDRTVYALIEAGDRLLEAGDSGTAQMKYREALNIAPSTLKASIWTRLNLSRQQPLAHPKLLRIQQGIEREFPDQDAFVSSHMAVWGKTNSFMEDGRLLQLSWKHHDLLPLPSWEWNLKTAIWAASQVRHLPGDFVELGVFKGHTTIVLAEYFDFASWPRRWWLYDTFEGIPADQQNEGWEERNRRAYEGTYSYEEVRDRFAAFPNIDVIKGRVPEILLERCASQIAFLHIDLNSAVAEIAALDLIFDKIVQGGVILFDDYSWMVSRAQQKAEKSWFDERGLSILEMPTGQGIFLKGP